MRPMPSLKNLDLGMGGSTGLDPNKFQTRFGSMDFHTGTTGIYLYSNGCMLCIQVIGPHLGRDPCPLVESGPSFGCFVRIWMWVCI